MKKAFTMVELIFVIVAAGIIAAVAMPKFDSTNLREAADQVASHIRYTQHLAMQDNKFEANNPNWFKSRWQIQFYENITNTSKCSKDKAGAWGYSIYSDKPNYTGNPNIQEVAKNPQNPNQLLSGGYNNTICIDSSENAANANTTPELRLGEKYDIKDITFSSSCSASRSKRISFDNMGRPLYGSPKNYVQPYGTPARNRLIREKCTISLCLTKPCKTAKTDDKIDITIEPETGFVNIL